MSDSKQSRRKERFHVKTNVVAQELQSALLDWQVMKHKMFQEWEERGIKRPYEPKPQSEVIERVSYNKLYGPGKSVKPFIRGEVLEPIEPAKLKEGTKLVAKDVTFEFKEPAVSFAMQKNLRVLELRLNAEGHLYSPKAFDPEWHWQTQAIWLRTIGMGYKEISKKIKKSLNTIKSMFKRLNITKFFPRTSRYDYATIGFGRKETPSGWTAILYGGSSGILHPSSEVTMDEKSGNITPLYKAKFAMGETIGKEFALKTEPFSLKKHKKMIKAGVKEDFERRQLITLEQKTVEIENLQKNIAEGFDPDTGTYLKKVK